ncbi:uncharacterized protein LOC126769420 [Nymphalis io]|uniref:uncharacterized protein LOC126769420 n=1 Tax=Inachis io TaxID=171585 RepID=UPI002168506C|nr:uncharacterized protein LOC126769420 [Nymphalis io]
MKFIWCCLAAALLNLTNAAVDVEKTVQQVQSILKANTLLPRLTRQEIIDLLNDIRAEDAIAKTTSKVESNASKTTTTRTANKKLGTTTTASYKNIHENEINTASQPTKLFSNVALENDSAVSTSAFKNVVESTTKSSGATLTVVLPYTPRDGSSLQELYTKPPRLQVVPEQVTPKPIKTTKTKDESSQAVKKAKTKNKLDFDLPAELQAFLDSHGLKGTPGQDNFLLPLEGFKPLPPPKIVDGNVQLPENLLLTYDLISPSDLTTPKNNNQKFAQTNFLYEPLRPQFPFELDTSSSESKHTVLPLDLPKPRKTKAVSNTPKPNYEPIDYEAIKVIPLNQGPSPVEDDVIVGADQSKRQANETDESSTTTTSTTESSNVDTDSKNSDISPPDTVPPDSDTGASFADLEDSFGGAAPVEPGDSELPPPRKNGFYWMVDWNSFLEVGDGDSKVNIRFEPKLGDPQMFLPVNVP